MADLARPELGDDDRHHLERVLRLRPGEEVTTSDGAGGWRRCIFGGGGLLEPVGEVAAVSTRRAPAVTVAFALTKGDRPEWTVQKLVEVGVDRIIPMVTRYTVVRWDGDKARRQAARLRSVARAAAMQSRQVWLPVVEDLQPFTSVVENGAGGGEAPAGVGRALAAGVALAQMGGGLPTLEYPTILVGPEGGWDEVELARGLRNIGLGPTVLRAETAAVAAGVLLCGLRAGVIRATDVQE